MNKFKTTGYILLIFGVILFSFSIFLYQMYGEGNLMLETFACMSSSCISRASIFLPAMFLGLSSLGMGLVIFHEDIYKLFSKRSKLE